MQKSLVQILSQEGPLEKGQATHSSRKPFGFPNGSVGKVSTCNVGDLGLITGLGRSPGGGHDKPLQYSFLENPPSGLQSMGSQKDTTERLRTHTFVDGNTNTKKK